MSTDDFEPISGLTGFEPVLQVQRGPRAVLGCRDRLLETFCVIICVGEA